MGINQYIQIGSKIKQARICKGIRQKDMAEKLGLSISTYSNYENNHREPEFDTIKKACCILGMTIDELISNQPKIGGWIPCSERLPEESLNSVIGWDEYRQRCCFVQYLGGRWVLGDDVESVKIAAWQPLPEEYHGQMD